MTRLLALLAIFIVGPTVAGLPATAATHKAAAVVEGSEHTCVLARTGTVTCMGSGGRGQLGVPNTANSDTPVSVPGIVGATAIAAGIEHTCAVLASTRVSCWGANEVGQAGRDPETAGTSVTPPATVKGLSMVKTLSAGREHTCALLTTGSVKCWGNNHEGELGDASTARSSTPVRVHRISNAVEIHATYFGTCALLADATVWCWGATGLPTSSLVPTKASISGVVGFSSGAAFNCAIVRSGAVKCWGAASLGQLGDGGVTASFASKPVRVVGLTNAVAISSGEAHSCAILADHSTWCWGYNAFCQLGTDINNCANSNVPVEVVGGNDFTKISLGVDDSCAVLRSSASVMCWGLNYTNQLGSKNIVGPSPAIPTLLAF